MAVDIANFLARNSPRFDRMEIDRDRYSNALLRNERDRIPQRNRAEDLEIQAQDQQLGQGRTAGARKMAADIFTAIAESPDPIGTGSMLVRSQAFRDVGADLKLPVDKFNPTPGDDPEQIRAAARSWAQAVGATFEQQGKTGIPGSLQELDAINADRKARGETPMRPEEYLAQRRGSSADSQLYAQYVAGAEDRGETPMSIEQFLASQAGRESGASAGAKATQERFGQQISDAYDAARALPVVHRGLELLNLVSTGGIERAKLAATELFGVTGANETELSSNLGKAVLQQLRSTFGAQFTQQEGERLASIEAGFGRSTEGNKRLLQQAVEVTERAIRRGISAARESNNDFDARELESALQYRFRYPQDQQQGGSDISALLDKYAPAAR